MKTILKKIGKILLVFIISTITIYTILTLNLICKECKENQIMLFSNDYAEDLTKIDKEKIKGIGDSIGLFAKLLEEDREKAPYQEDIENHEINDGHEHTIGDFFDPLGFSVWISVQKEISYITTRYISISILSGFAITIAYITISTKKLHNILKVIVGYIGVMLVIPPIYMYTWTYRLWDVISIYKSMPKYFYIGYTIIFIVMFVINYWIGIKMSKKLNQAMKKEKE